MLPARKPGPVAPTGVPGAARGPSRAGLVAALFATLLLPCAAGAFAASEPATPRGNPLAAPDAYDVAALLNAAEAGDAHAAFLLGSRYASGRAGVRDDSEALHWFRKAADGGLAEAQFNLGQMYARGLGVGRDLVQAARWYRAAAKQHLAEAQYNLALLYAQGLGVARDETLAAKWMRKAARHHLARAEYNMGVFSEFGRGVKSDPLAATVWYRRAAADGYAAAKTRLAALQARARAATPPSAAVASPAAVARHDKAKQSLQANAWVLAHASDRYTLQLLSLRDEKSVLEYLRGHDLVGRGGYFRSRRGADTWYCVIYGAYASAAAARRAAGRLPGAFGVAHPWVRSFSDIRKSMID